MNTGYRTILAEYLKWLDTLGYSDGLIYSCRLNTYEFLEWLSDNRVHDITQLTNRHIYDYHAYLETRPNLRYKGRMLSVGHLNKSFFAIDKLLEFLHQYGMADAPVPMNRRMAIDQQARILNIQTLTQQEVKTLYNCIPDTYKSFDFARRQAKQYELKLIFALFYGCGLRRSEGYNLRIKDVDFDRKTVFVEQGKNYKDRVVPMSAGVYNELQDYVYNFRHKLRLNHNRLFISINEGSLGHKLQSLQKVCGDEAIRAKRLSLHVLRHSIATHLLQNGMSIENIALFLGHSSLDSTQIYTHLA